jgi:hypothetical protein
MTEKEALVEELNKEIEEKESKMEEILKNKKLFNVIEEPDTNKLKGNTDNLNTQKQ